MLESAALLATAISAIIHEVRIALDALEGPNADEEV